MKIAVGMSGGVDSSVAAKMLKDEGHEVVGLFLKLWQDPQCKIAKENRCCDYEALEDARAVAGKLKIPFYVINAREEFKKEVVDYFLKEYSALRTPNPCIVCNDKIKFDLLLKRVLSLGCDYLATGHYARIIQKSKIKNQKFNDYYLFAGVDKGKDQSYMLYRLSQYQLSKTLFPLGELTKKEVRAKAVEWDLPVKEKPESQEICFVGEKDYRLFLRRCLGEEFFKPGEIVDVRGKILGHHEGLINFTIGQRKGISQDQKSKIKNQNDNSKCKNEKHLDREPLYVVGFDARPARRGGVGKNQLIVGEDKETYSKEMLVGDLTWVSKNTSEVGSDSSEVGSGGLKVKIRYRHPAVGCRIKPVSGKLVSDKLKNSVIASPDLMSGRGNLLEHKIASSLISRNDKARNESAKYLKVLFKEPQRAVTPGQSAVIYLGEEVLGGGIIVG